MGTQKTPRPSSSGAPRPPGPLEGAALGLLLTAPLVAVSFAAWRAAGTPFLPFDLFDWLARALPGPVVTFGIDAIVGAIRTLGLGDVSDVAKTAEQALAIGSFLLLGVVAAAILVAAVRGRRSAMTASLATATALALATFLASLAVNPSSRSGPLQAGLWTLVLWLAWGLALGWARDRWVTTPARPPEPVRPRDRAPDADPTRTVSAVPLDRRRFLVRLGGATAAITVVGASVGALVRGETGAPSSGGDGGDDAAPPWSARNPLPNAGAEPRPVPGTRPELTPVDDHYRIDINTVPPRVDAGTWRLRVDGLVDRPRSFTLDGLRSYEPTHRFITLSCISNRLGGDLIGTTRWTGVSLQRLLPDLGLLEGATHLRVSSVDGFFEVVDLDTVRADGRIMLAYAWDGRPLADRHGFPLRIYVPDVYGMKQPKWIDRIEAIDAWEPGYWVERGWDAEARMRATSVIDTVRTDRTIAGDDGPRVPVGGIAHAGARGIERVEVRVDDGPWRQAELRPPLSDTTWVLWRYAWPFEPGRHTFTVRCVDGNGEPQIAERNPVRPSGATGLVSREATLRDAPADGG